MHMHVDKFRAQIAFALLTRGTSGSKHRSLKSAALFMQEKHSKAGGSATPAIGPRGYYEQQTAQWRREKTGMEGRLERPVEKEWSMKMKDVNNSEIHLKGEQKRGRKEENLVRVTHKNRRIHLRGFACALWWELLTFTPHPHTLKLSRWATFDCL